MGVESHREWGCYEPGVMMFQGAILNQVQDRHYAHFERSRGTYTGAVCSEWISTTRRP